MVAADKDPEAFRTIGELSEELGVAQHILRYWETKFPQLRPLQRAGNRRFDEVVANYAARHRVKPGLTGLAQVRGYRGPTPTERQILLRVESDLEYIGRWSLWLDFLIILRTLLVVVRMRNAL